MIEIMLNNMFKISDEISNEAIAEMQRRCCEETKQWKRRHKAQERLGYSREEADRQRKCYKKKVPKWMRRKLTNTDREILAQAWH